ncbi:MAG: DEAD/DEAH box helicase family protein [Fibromonadaceae bacterium]|jgi:type I restriction enzyme R subunit|nr:DEAD/DEAH box helicase family protein [Fibromonadaceae bacterium]
MIFNENSRVKIPALIHLTRLGYQYLSLKNTDVKHSLDNETNIIKHVFKQKFLEINSKATEKDFEKEFQNIVLELGQGDLGKSFYNRLINKGNSTYKIIDWENFNKNSFHICTELTCKNGEDEFRPDITVFINGLPLAFIEVKKPNNPEGIKAERDRINERFKNEKFRKFINITQLLVFSNNMEYDDTVTHSGLNNQLQGAFYATTAKNNDVKFNHFREELKSELIDGIKEIDDKIETEILKDNNLQTLKFSPEFLTNKNTDSPTNRILSSLFTKNRLKMFLQFGIAYVDVVDDKGEPTLEKHIMRYPQFFASKSICKFLSDGKKKGVIWHTQGSGKTALAFYNVRYLTDYFSKKGIVPKFYFIVDRLDLLKQAKDEFTKRGLGINIVDSKEELQNDFKQNTANKDITVVNIQKFKEDTTAFDNSGYDINVQRIYFIDEAHRSYDPAGSSLANLYNSDKNSIKIALTGTPLILYKRHEKSDEEGDEENLSNKAELKITRNIFGDYIHKYYYNNSIKDGYTLKLLREEIETGYKEKVRKIIRDVEKELRVKLGTLNKKDLYAHEKFAEPMLSYILDDFSNFRMRFGDKTIGAMVVCDSSEQARKMFELFNKSETEISAALILHNENDKETRENQVKAFKKGNIDILFVYSMLLTGFDAPRLKKLYLGRKIKTHNLLQTLTRVNRPYKEFRFGHVVDFADISAEFDITNRAYFEELNREYDIQSTGENENDVFGSLFIKQEEIDGKMQNAELILSDFSTDNLEVFSKQIIDVTDKEKILNLKNALENIRDVYNIARLLGYTKILERLDFKRMLKMLVEVSDRLRLLNLQKAISDINSKELLNVAIENVVFSFTKIGEEELKMLANELQELAHKTRAELGHNWNQKDPEWVSLYEDFRNLLDKHKINENNFTKENAEFISRELLQIFNRIKELNRKNSVLQDKFSGDKKYARIFKHIEKSGEISKNISLYEIMKSAKISIDEKIFLNENMLGNEGYFTNLVSKDILESFEDSKYKKTFDASAIKNLANLTAGEYFAEYRSI